MNFTRNLLVVSLALNAAWFGGVIFGDSSSDETPASPEAAGPKHAAPAASPLDLAGSRETNLQTALRAHDLATLRDELRRAGFPEDELRSILGTRAWKRAHAAACALAGVSPDRWWTSPPDPWSRLAELDPESRARLRTVQHELENELERLLGSAFDPESHPRLRFLPPEKAAAVHRIDADYERMQQRLANELGGLRLPSDEEKFRLLKEEKQRDLAALLTPEELRAYEARFSPDAEAMRYKLYHADLTEEEYLRLFDRYRALDDKRGPRGDVADSPLHRELRAVIGEERFRDYLRDRDPRYQRLQAASLRNDLPPGTAARFYDMQSEASARARHVATDSSLDDDAKRQAVAKIAADARTQAVDAFGAETAAALMENDALGWIRELRNGVVSDTRDENDSPVRQPLLPAPDGQG